MSKSESLSILASDQVELVAYDEIVVGLPDRKDRLDALKARRKILAPQGEEASLDMNRSASAVKRPMLVAQATFLTPLGDKIEPMLTSAPSAAAGPAIVKQVLAKVMQLLTQTPVDQFGMVPDMPFSYAGVERLMSMLRQRANQPDAPGTKAAATVLRFLDDPNAAGQIIHGVSVEKLQTMIHHAETMRTVSDVRTMSPRAKPQNGALMGSLFGAAAGRAPQNRMAQLNGGTASGGGQSPQRQMIAKALELLKSTPADHTGLVTGTPFTKTGVARLMTMLHQRADDGSTSRGKLIAIALRFLEPTGGDMSVVHGASVQKLQMLAKRA